MQIEKGEEGKMTAGHLGARYLGGGRTSFRVWAPLAENVAVRLVIPEQREIPMEKDEKGYFTAEADAPPGTLYFYALDGRRYPDPASRYQPRGVHGPSEVVADDFPWADGDWEGRDLRDYIIYELHVGTFTPEGTFDAVIGYLPGLKDMGITAVELMPVAQFPGGRNWGYDGVLPYAVQDSYGGPAGLRRLVDACHREGLAIVLDVVYNHLGPEGNHLAEFGPYFTDRYKTPWGAAINFDGADSDEVRRFFIENALYWVTDFHFDALRLDALHAILDISPYTFIEELAAGIHKRAAALGRKIYLIGESSADNARLVTPVEKGGYGIDAQWNDDFHHALHTLLTGETGGYYRDYGEIRHLVKAVREGFAYSGEYSAFRRRRHGTSSRDIPAERFVVFAQNHDQVGNRARAERLGGVVSFESLKLAAGVVLLSPYLPLLFMGEEYGETAPFPYFISHGGAGLVEAVRRGRRREFAGFGWRGELPDPQAEATFLSAKLDHGLGEKGEHHVLYTFYRELLRLRGEVPALARVTKEGLEVQGDENNRTITLKRRSGDSQAAILYNFNQKAVAIEAKVGAGEWRKRLDSAEAKWLGAGPVTGDLAGAEGVIRLTLAPRSVVLYVKEG
jgi:maltooligosyltrehalose trehalohydrolase